MLELVIFVSLLSAAKPPVPDKPQIFKKPTPNGGLAIGNNSKPEIAPKRNKATALLKRPPAVKYAHGSSPNKPPMDNNIYDEVCPEAPSLPDTAIPKLIKRSSKKLEQFFGEELRNSVDEQSVPAAIEKKRYGGKGKQPVEPRVRKISAPLPPHTAIPNDGNGLYAIIPIPDVDKTATKKPNQSDMKTRKTSDGSGKPILRNSGDMSSGDSGVGTCMHSNVLRQETKIRNRDRRMSRRIIRKEMKSTDSDFDSDDEPIGTESDFDSDASDDILVSSYVQPSFWYLYTSPLVGYDGQ